MQISIPSIALVPHNRSIGVHLRYVRLKFLAFADPTPRGYRPGGFKCDGPGLMPDWTGQAASDFVYYPYWNSSRRPRPSRRSLRWMDYFDQTPAVIVDRRWTRSAFVDQVQALIRFRPWSGSGLDQVQALDNGW